MNLSITINSVNDAPYFIENNINIEQISTIETITIEYEADDVDNLLSELNFSIYYGSGNNWHRLIKNYRETTYTWKTNNVPDGNYYIKIVVSDGINNSTWISSESYLIMHEGPLLNPVTIGLIISGGIGLVIILVLVIRAKKRKKEPLPITESGN